MQLAAVLVSLLSLITSNAFATCDDYRLDKDGGVMEDMPVLNQRNVGSCYAQVSAQVLTAKLRLSDPKKYKDVMVSPLSLALGFREYSDKNRYSSQNIPKRVNVIDGEKTYFPLNASEAFPICEYKDVESKISQLDFNFLFGNTSKALETVFASPNNETINKISYDLCTQDNPQSHNLKDIRDVLSEVIKNDSPVKFVRYLIEGECKPIEIAHGLVNVNGQHPAMSHNEVEIMNFVDKMFDARHKLPIAIDYCADFFHQGASARGRKEFYASNDTSEDSCGAHASVIVGRRTSISPKNGEKTCEYLIRNSWGTSCLGYNAEYTAKCEQGQVWVTKETLLKNILGANSLE